MRAKLEGLEIVQSILRMTERKLHALIIIFDYLT